MKNKFIRRIGVQIRWLQWASVFLAVTLFGAALALGQTTSIRGMVKDRDGTVHAGVIVLAKSLATNEVWQATTDSSGEYVFSKLPFGKYRIILASVGHAAHRGRLVNAIPGQSASIDIVLDEDIWPALIKGRVQDQRGRDIPGAAIEVAMPDDLETTESDTRGEYAVAVLSFGNIVIKVTAPGFQDQSKSIRLRTDQNKILNFKLKKK